MKKQLWHAVFKIFPSRKNNKTAESGGFCEELLSENDFEAVLFKFCCYEDIIVLTLRRGSSEAKISTRTLLELCQLTKQLIS